MRDVTKNNVYAMLQHGAGSLQPIPSRCHITIPTVVAQACDVDFSGDSYDTRSYPVCEHDHPNSHPPIPASNLFDLGIEA